MSNIVKIIQLDKALLKPYYKYFFIIFLVPALLTFDYKAVVPSILFAMCMLSMTSSYIFSVAEKNDLNRLYGLLPVNKNDIVTGRYFFTAIMGIVSIVIMVVLDLIVLTISKVIITAEDVILGIGAGIFIYSLFTAIQLPGFFKFGAIKGRFFTFIPMLGLFTISFLSKNIKGTSDSSIFSLQILNSPMALLVFSILMAVVFYGISIGITQSIYRRMEL